MFFTYGAMSDREIIDGFLKGDPQSHSMVEEWINSVLRASSGNPGVSSQDIARDTIEKLFRNLCEGKFRFDASLKTYVQRIARYTMIDEMRGKRFTRTDNNFTIDGARDPGDLFKVFEDDEELRLFRRIVNRMDEGCRNLWRLIFHEELPYREVAAQLNISEGAVKTRVLRCKQKAIEIRKDLT